MIARRLLFAAPLVGLAGGAAGFYAYMALGRDPRGVPSVLVGRAPPAFDLPPLAEGGLRLTNASIPRGRPAIVNFFASWCAPCRIEHPQLLRLAREGIALVGIAYKDKPEDSRRFLAELGNPYLATGIDRDGRTGIDFGLYGVPETYVIDRAGHIRKRIVGPLSPAIVERELLPLLRALERP